MIGRFFSKPRPALEARAPEGERIYAIGDIHGRLDLLEQLLTDVEADSESRGPADTKLIFLGDLIDRGPDSAQVVERTLKISQERPNTHFLLGNHEEVFLKAMTGDLKALAFFLRIGGRETVLSYGVSESDYLTSEYAELFALLQDCVPAAHLDFLRSFQDLIILGDYAFVHAGIRPGVPLDKQRPSDLRWIREEFMGHAGTHDKIIVHGHTISEDVEVLANRIGLDTGAYASGKLSAMGFERDGRWLLSAGNS